MNEGVGREPHELSQNGQAYMGFDICEDIDLTGEKWRGGLVKLRFILSAGTGLSAFHSILLTHE